MHTTKCTLQATTRRRALSRAIAVAAMMTAGHGWAMQFDTGNSDLEVRWDNTAKYNLMVRVEDQDTDITNSASPSLFDDANLAFDTGVVSNRADLLSELELVWKKSFGFRVSGAGWYDHAYSGDSDHPGVNKDYRINGNYTDTWGSLTVRPGQFNDYADDYAYRGGELLDAFVFANFQVGSGEASVRAGRHTLYWGQSLFASGATNGIAGAMAPIDQAKGLGVPGSEAKELFLPTNKLSGSFQINSNLSLVGYYSFEWEPTRYPAPGSYFALSEISMDQAEFATLVAGQVDPVTRRAHLAAHRLRAEQFRGARRRGMGPGHAVRVRGRSRTGPVLPQLPRQGAAGHRRRDRLSASSSAPASTRPVPACVVLDARLLAGGEHDRTRSSATYTGGGFPAQWGRSIQVDVPRGQRAVRHEPGQGDRGHLLRHGPRLPARRRDRLRPSDAAARRDLTPTLERPGAGHGRAATDRRGTHGLGADVSAPLRLRSAPTTAATTPARPAT